MDADLAFIKWNPSEQVIMRSYAKNFTFKKTVNYKQRQERVATEWDIRVDVSDALTVENVIGFIKEQLDDVGYVLVSGVERPDMEKIEGPRREDQTVVQPVNQYGSKEHHVHVCLVLHVPLNRAGVLKLVRGQRKLGDEYAAPRNPKFSYAGWVIHHSKPSYKIPGEPLIRYEYGTLPMDPYTTEWALKIDAILKKWGSPGMKNRFGVYSALLNKHKIKEKIEKLQMSLEDTDVDE